MFFAASAPGKARAPTDNGGRKVAMPVRSCRLSTPLLGRSRLGENPLARRRIDGDNSETRQPVGGAFVRLLDSSDEFTAEVVASATGDFRFFAAPGSWTVRALSSVGTGDAVVAPHGAGIHEVDVKVA